MKPSNCLKTWFWSPDENGHLIGKTLMLGKTEGRKRRGCQRMRWLVVMTDAMDLNLGKLREMVRDREAWHAAVYGVAKSWTWRGNWTIEILETGETLILNSGLCTLTKYLENWCLNWLYFYANCKSDIEFTVFTVAPFDQQCSGNVSPSS